MNEQGQINYALIAGAAGKYELSDLVMHALRHFLNNPYESCVIVDNEARVQFMDRASEKFFGLDHGGAKDIDIRELIPESGLPMAIQTGVPAIGRVFKVKGKNRIGSVHPLNRDGEIIGAVGKLLFHSFEEVEKINREIARLRKEIRYFEEKEQYEHGPRYAFSNILGTSLALRETVDFAKKISTLDTDVLIVGESGTGKELFAHSIHGVTGQKRPFVKVNCPTIPFDLAESELFGYSKGAFSGALSSGKPGKFEMANNGTIFLDEITSLPLSIQAKLLRVVQEREIERLGSTKTQKLNFKLVLATNVDLKILVNQGKFREDLYYRISKAIVRIPPLRERKEDLAIYIAHFVNKISESFKIPAAAPSQDAVEVLLDYSWPGNVRELINVLEQSVLKAWNAKHILLEHLPAELLSHRKNSTAGLMKKSAGDLEPVGFSQEIKEKERQLIISAMHQTKGNKKMAAKLLGMPRSTFYEKMKRYCIAEDGRQ